MLPNHALLIIDEQFGALESIYSGRIDLGIGRAPGTDFKTAFALRHSFKYLEECFLKTLSNYKLFFKNITQQKYKNDPSEGIKNPNMVIRF